MVRTSLFLIISTFVLATTIFGFHQERRVALVLSNTNYANDYRSGGNFNTPTPDVALTLSKLGFEVIESIEPTKELIAARMKEFAASLKEADVGLIYYSGRMVQASGRNYLIPTDLKRGELLRPELNGIALDPLLYEMERKVRHSFVFLNACRLDLPEFGAYVTRKMLKSCRGLEPIGAEGNVVVTHSSLPSERIISHRKNEEVFVKALTSNLMKAELPMQQLLQNVYSSVHETTGARQTPWSENGTGKRFVFNTGFIPADRDEDVQPKMASLIPVGGTLSDKKAGSPEIRAIVESRTVERHKLSAKADIVKEERTVEQIAMSLPDPERFIADQNNLIPNNKKQLKMDRRTAIRVIQKKLKEFSCYQGRIDGIWGRYSRKAVSSFRRMTDNGKLRRYPDVTLYKAVSEYSGPVCGRTCGDGKRINKRGQCQLVARNELPFVPVITDNTVRSKVSLAKRSAGKKLRTASSVRIRKRYKVRKRSNVRRKYVRPGKRYKRKYVRRYSKRTYRKKYRRYGKAVKKRYRKRRYTRKYNRRNTRQRRFAYYQSDRKYYYSNSW